VIPVLCPTRRSGPPDALVSYALEYPVLPPDMIGIVPYPGVYCSTNGTPCILSARLGCLECAWDLVSPHFNNAYCTLS
jgi:hypothetical protein